MKHPFQRETHLLTLPDQHLTWYRYTNPAIEPGRRLLLVHGAGVAGRDTWEMLLAFLAHWHEIVVPDMRGTGDTRYPDGVEHGFVLGQLVGDLGALLNTLQWDHFDLGGYSLGGLVSLRLKQQLGARIEKQFLLESALLDRPSMHETVLLRERYSEAAEHLRSTNTEQGIRAFLDTISPQRKTAAKAEDLTISRLGQRPIGFAHALDAVTQAIHHLDRDQLLAAQGDVTSFIGGNSVHAMHQLHRDLADQMPNWHYFMITGTDHSLPFQKPRQIARIMNEEMVRFMTGRES